ncbi:MAG: DUF3592 domain-containing protein [Aliidongia sp.]
MYGRTGSVVITLVGVILLAIALYTAWNTFTFLRTATRATGTISALNAGGSHPQIDFQTDAGQSVSYPQGGFIFGLKTGDTVTVLYSPADARATATIEAVGALWFATILTGGLGAVFVLGGILWSRNAAGG